MDLKAHGWMDDDDVGLQCLTGVLFFFLCFLVPGIGAHKQICA
jgi:hypothetical protein